MKYRIWNISIVVFMFVGVVGGYLIGLHLIELNHVEGWKEAWSLGAFTGMGGITGVGFGNLIGYLLFKLVEARKNKRPRRYL